MAMLRLSSSKLVHQGILSEILSHTSAMSIRREKAPFADSISFSTDSSSDSKKQIDLKLAGILKSEIASRKIFLAYPMPKVSKLFPFKVKDEPWERDITMSRDYNGEKIDVVVFMPYRMDDESKHSYSDSDDEGRGRSLLEMKMTVTKENGKLLDIGITAIDGEIRIDTVSFQEPAEGLGDDVPFFTFGPYDVKEDEELQKGMKEYVEVRGLKDFGFLYDYMAEKSRKLPVDALKKLRDFIEYSDDES